MYQIMHISTPHLFQYLRYYFCSLPDAAVVVVDVRWKRICWEKTKTHWMLPPLLEDCPERNYCPSTLVTMTTIWMMDVVVV